MFDSKPDCVVKHARKDRAAALVMIAKLEVFPWQET
jgi:hypothetical protein